MKIVIEIPDNLKKKIDDGFTSQVIISKLWEAVRDGTPVVHGEWIYEKGFTADTWECDQCHEAQTKKSNFCPSCGADMRGANADRV